MKHITPLILLLSNGVNCIYTTIPQGYVGVWSYLNKIQDKLVQDFTVYNPITSNIQLVKIIQDNDYVNNVKCISKEGIYLMIPQIEIANKIKKEHVIDIIKNYGIDYDKKLVVRPIAQFIRELCAERTIDEIVITDFHLLDNLLKTEIQRQVDEIDSGITIDYVRITSVDFPDDIRNLRLEKEKEKNNKGIQEEAMKTEQVKKNKEAMVAKLDNEIRMENSRVDNERLLQNINADRQRKTIENIMVIETTQTNVQKIRLEAEAQAYKMTTEYEGIKLLYSVKEYANVGNINIAIFSLPSVLRSSIVLKTTLATVS
jgi:regulator of protease activity HflC (stomatin/prohibitin superfamily)